jgi:hypothetical protein
MKLFTGGFTFKTLFTTFRNNTSFNVQGNGCYSILFRVPSGGSEATITSAGGGNTVSIAANQSISLGGNIPFVGNFDLYTITLDSAGADTLEVVQLFLVEK